MAPTTNLDAAVAPPPRLDLDARATWRRLRMAGWTADEAANLVAHLSGLRLGRQAWTVREIETLLFIRSLVETGRIDGDRLPDGSEPSSAAAAMPVQRASRSRMSDR